MLTSSAIDNSPFSPCIVTFPGTVTSKSSERFKFSLSTKISLLPTTTVALSVEIVTPSGPVTTETLGFVAL
jgi:hypothetical protein